MKNFIILLNRTETNTTDTVSKSTLYSQSIIADGFTFRSYKSVNKSEDRTQGVEFYTLSPSNKKVFTGTFFPLSKIVGIYDEQFTSPSFWDYAHSTSVCLSQYDLTGSASNPHLVVLPFWSLQTVSIIARSSQTEPIVLSMISDPGIYGECKFFENIEIQPNSFQKILIPENLQIRTNSRTAKLICIDWQDFSLDFFFQLEHT